MLSEAVLRRATRQAIDTDSAASTSLAARSPERTAPSTQPHITAELAPPRNRNYRARQYPADDIRGFG
jgi:hypothetical protein